ncbi:MAG: acetolactate synthase small subunit [Candidatus Limnocylindrales bacterium]
MSTTDQPDAAQPAHSAPAARYVPGSGEKRRHVLVAIVNDRPGVLNRVASLMRARSFNIESLAVGHTEDPTVSRMTITLHGDDYGVEQVSKQLYRLIDVLKVQDVTAERRIEHELALVKIRATNANRGEIVKIVEMAKGRVVDLATDSVVVEATGTEDDIDRLIELVTPFGIKELVRTGSVVMLRGGQVVAFEEKA